LRALVNAMALEVQLCNLIGHSRPEEGSEHHFAYLAEKLTSAETSSGERAIALHTHGELVGPGIALMAERQGQDVRGLRKAMDDAGVPMSALPPDVIEATLRGLPAYVRENGLAYSIAWEM
jgi:glycerol-1-phosphate dehydrogenase [NAD(P)+]